MWEMPVGSRVLAQEPLPNPGPYTPTQNTRALNQACSSPVLHPRHRHYLVWPVELRLGLADGNTNNCTPGVLCSPCPAQCLGVSLSSSMYCTEW